MSMTYEVEVAPTTATRAVVVVQPTSSNQRPAGSESYPGNPP